MSQQVVLPGFYLHQLAEVVAGYGVNTAEWLESLQVPQPQANANACTVCFPFAPDADSGFLQSLFRCRVQYQQDWAGIHLPKELADKPLLMANSGSYRDALEICQKELETIQQNSSLTDRIYCLMLSNNTGFPSLELTARYFHMTPRTLHRRLQQEDTCYKDILDQVRQRLAIQYLDSGKMTVQEVAYSLGYSEVANFRRAFKRWHGIPPSDYLKQQ